jgi:hypothetical protein
VARVVGRRGCAWTQREPIIEAYKATFSDEVVPCNRPLQPPPQSPQSPLQSPRVQRTGVVPWGRALESCLGVVPWSRLLHGFNIFWEDAQVCVANWLIVAVLWGNSTSGHDSGARLRGATPGHDSIARLRGTSPGHDCRVRAYPTTSCPQIPRQQTDLRHAPSYCVRAAFHCRGSSSSMRLCGQLRLSLSKTSRR